MRAFSYLCSLLVTSQRWQLQYCIQKPHAACKQHSPVFDRTGVIADGSFTLQEQEFSTLLAPVTLTLTLTR